MGDAALARIVDALLEVTSVVPCRPVILVVDDFEPIVELCATVLDQAGAEVLTAFDGAGAMAVAEEAPALDGLLCDIVLPDTSGFDVARRLRERRPRLEVVLMSGYSARELRERGSRLLGAQFVAKPFDVDGLLNPFSRCGLLPAAATRFYAARRPSRKSSNAA
jgi:two-component system, OmpR family, response regulator